MGIVSAEGAAHHLKRGQVGMDKEPGALKTRTGQHESDQNGAGNNT